MPNVVVLAKDERVRRQLEMHLEELSVDKLRYASFASMAELSELYFRDRTRASSAAAAPTRVSEGAELKLFSEINLLIFALDTIEQKPGPWIDEMREQLKHFGHYPGQGELRLIMIKFEDDVPKLDLMHPHLDDLIYLPLDRLVLLQKLQIFLALPRQVAPSYLFNQEVAKDIEISKITKLDRLSDVGLAIRNPVPLRKGLPGHFYVNLPGERTGIEIRAKVLRSEPHPGQRGQFLVYFAFFGIPRPALSAVRKILSKAPGYKSLMVDDRERFSYRPDNLFQEENERRHFGTLIIDADEINGRTLASTVQKEMDRLNVESESSYQVFLHRYLEVGAHEQLPPKPTEPKDFFKAPITLTISVKDLRCLGVEPAPGPESLFLGHHAAKLFSAPERWINLMQDRESRSILEESVQLVAAGRVLEKLIALNDLESVHRGVRARMYGGTAEGTAMVELSPASEADIELYASNRDRRRELEALIVDTNFLPEDPAAWIESLRLRAVQIGMVTSPDQLKFWFLTDGETIHPQWLTNADVLGLFARPVDIRQLLFSMSEHLPNKNTLYHFDNLGWSEPNLAIHVSKPIHLEALSEYGATLRAPHKLVPGSVIYLRRSIYENAPNGCLAARVYACEPHPTEKEEFQIFTTYFGINDAFLKFARTWIRENYANSKAKEN